LFTIAQAFSTSSAAACIVPQVASRSSTKATFSHFLIVHSCNSISSLPYSNPYLIQIVFPGSFQAFLIITNGLFSSFAIASPNKNHLASSPAITSAHLQFSAISKIIFLSDSLFFKSGEISLKSIHSLGKLGTSVI